MPEWLDRLADRAAQHSAGALTVAPTRDAATVVLLRDGAAGLEVFLQRRAPTLAFAAGMYVFPGGKTEPDDTLPDGAALPAAWAAAIAGGDPVLAGRLVAAAIREVAEEVGVAVTVADLRPWAHWVTPEPEPRRYDTRFFVARLPAGEAVRDTGDTESDTSAWFRPADTVDLPVLPPTAFTLAELAAFPDVAAVLAVDRQITRVLPRVVASADTLRLLLPGDDGYPADGSAPAAPAAPAAPGPPTGVPGGAASSPA